jgi:hypothetical protein
MPCTPISQGLVLRAGRVRRKEAANIAKMNLIRGTNMALQFAVLPIAAFITFSVVRHSCASQTAAPSGQHMLAVVLPAASFT